MLRAFGAALERGNATAAAACFAPDAVYEEPPRFVFTGQAAIQSFFADFVARHTDISFTVVRTLADASGAALAAEWRFAHTRTSDGARRVYAGMCLLDLAAGRIARWRGYSALVG